MTEKKETFEEQLEDIIFNTSKKEQVREIMNLIDKREEKIRSLTLDQIIGSVETATKITTITRMLQDENRCEIPVLKMKVGRKYGIEPEDIMSTFLALILLHHTKDDVQQ